MAEPCMCGLPKVA